MTRAAGGGGAFALAAALGALVAHASAASTPPDPAARAAQDALLLEKARAFRAAITARHLAPEGYLLYTVDLAQLDAQRARHAYPALADTPTYTGLLVSSACARADVETGAARAEALADADRGLAGLELLAHVTGRPGLLARGVQRLPPPEPAQPEHRWFPGGPGFESWTWRGDASQDQYANGLLPALEACRLHFPERVRALARDVARYLLETDMQLVDPDGRRTTYGDLSARSKLGWNAIAKLAGYAVFALAAELDGDPAFARQRDWLRDQGRVVATSSITNVRILGITNYSNDLMAWNLYRVLVPLARRTRDPALADLRRGMLRSWLRVREDRNAYFAILLCRLEPEACDPEALAQARDTLLRFPLEKRRLGPAPELASLPRALLPGRKGHPRARALVPIELRPPDSFEWKASPYRVISATTPTEEYTGVDYLSAYWLYRGL